MKNIPLNFIVNFFQFLYTLKGNFGRIRSDQEGTKSPKVWYIKMNPLLWMSRDSGSFCHVQVCPHTKSKKADPNSVLLDSRNTNARALATGGGT